MEKERIEFRKGEQYCRFDGILMDEDGCEKVFGYPEELRFLTDKTILIDSKLYTNDDLATIVKSLGEFHEETEDSGIMPEYYIGMSLYDNCYIIPTNRLEMLAGVKQIFPFEQFATDYSEISLERFNEFYKCLNEFYDSVKPIYANDLIE